MNAGPNVVAGGLPFQQETAPSHPSAVTWSCPMCAEETAEQAMVVVDGEGWCLTGAPLHPGCVNAATAERPGLDCGGLRVIEVTARDIETQGGVWRVPRGGRTRLSRRAGWRKHPHSRSVSRPGPFGNPFTARRAVEVGYTLRDAPGASVAAFEAWLLFEVETWPIDDGPAKRARLLEGLPRLQGFDLACWCGYGAPCHVWVLLDVFAGRTAVPGLELEGL